VYQLRSEGDAARSKIDADSIRATLEQNLSLYKFLQQRKESRGDRVLTTELAFPLFEKYLEFLSGEAEPMLEKVFEVMELGKARLLTERLQRAEVKRFAGITDSILAREQSLETDLAKKREELEGLVKGEETVDMARVDREIDALKMEQKAFLEGLKQAHPAYYNMQYVHAPISIEEARADLRKEEAMLSYFVGDSSVYMLLLKQETGKFLRVPLDFPLRKWVEDIREAMYEHEEVASRSDEVVQAHAAKFCTAAYGIYDKLLASFVSDLPSKVRVIPDGVLSFIPFDVLLSEPPTQPLSFRQHAYLIHRFQFCYSLSATLHHQLSQTKSQPAPNSTLVVAPTFSASTRFKHLRHNAEEARNIQQAMGGELLEGVAATAAAFRKKAADFRILHIASHAKSDDQNGDSSYIAFSTSGSTSSDSTTDFLYARDLYGIPLNADLVVLSACETALGEWQTGEGIQGLNRACMYAGAKSTVTSLWQVDDTRSSGLMAEFYAGLRAGLSKDAALRDAKRAYLKSESPAHPYYWASFVQIGNAEPIDMPGNSKMMWWLLAGLAVPVVLLWRLRKGWFNA
ncbi:MAG: CHAT domain-containing protein, partial [Bacteroidota bacterium]